MVRALSNGHPQILADFNAYAKLGLRILKQQVFTEGTSAPSSLTVLLCLVAEDANHLFS
jgi:hypothetical protein